MALERLTASRLPEQEPKPHLEDCHLSPEEELGSDGDWTANSPAAGARPSAGLSKPYTRRPKPPYSYIALIAMAIRDSAAGRLTLAEINDYLMSKFPFFRGSYSGWRNSVRHNLSLNDCFVKVLRDPTRPWGKDNFWMLNPRSEYTFADGLFRRRRKRIGKKPQTKPEDELDTALTAAEDSSRAGARFSSPFAIDSILSRPFSRREENPPTAAPQPGPLPRYPTPLALHTHSDVIRWYHSWNRDSNLKHLQQFPLQDFGYPHVPLYSPLQAARHPFRIDALLSGAP